MLNLSVKVGYAAAAMVELAIHHGESGPLRLREIAARHEIPQQFLVQILQQLKRAGLITSTRGAAGGYRLARRPDQVTLTEIVEAVEGLPALPESLAGKPGMQRALCQIWQRILAAQREILDQTRLDTLADQVRGQTEAMYHI